MFSVSKITYFTFLGCLEDFILKINNVWHMLLPSDDGGSKLRKFPQMNLHNINISTGDEKGIS